jgi:hypothetical protein
MQFHRRALLGLLTGFALSSCSDNRTSGVLTSKLSQPVAPLPGQATVVFLHPGSGRGASVFDLATDPPLLVGILFSGQKAAFSTTPGTHRFMVIGESADFMDATLDAGKTYYARITPRTGVWKPRYSLEPVTKSDPTLTADLASCSWVTNTDVSLKWEKDNLPSIQGKKAKDLPPWVASENRPILKADDGA